MESGMKFAQSQMAKYGWKEGQGLGREETGMTETIKVKLKFDNAGFGHDQAEEFTFQWWDHIFNKAAENISVSKNEKGGIEIQRKEELVVTKSRPSVAAMKEKLYGSFVKGGTLQGAEEVSTKDSSDESDDDEPRDMSMTLSDDQLFKLCGGRTAHKGARHGLNMNAKLERVRLQEEELMRKWKSEAQQHNSSQHSSSMSNDIQVSGQGTPTEKKIKKKKHKELVEESLSNTGYEKTKNKRKYTCDEENTGEEEEKKKKKKKKKNKHLDQETMDDSGIESIEYEIKENKENSKKKQKGKVDNEDIEDYESKSNKKREFEQKIEEQGQSKKKKKKSKTYNHENDMITSEICESPDVTFKKKRKKDKIDFSEVEVKKKKKKKKCKEMAAIVEDNYEENRINIDELNIISPECKKKKKKKTEKIDCIAIEVVEVKIKKKKLKKSKEKEYEEIEMNFEKLSTISTEIKEKKKKKKTNEICVPETEIRVVKKKRKSKSIDADIQTIPNLENKSSKKKN